jgi:hypothetical protein
VFRPWQRPGRALSLPLAIAALFATSRSAADEGQDVKWHVSPYVNARATDTGHSLALGVDAQPSPLSIFGARLAAIVQKAAPDQAQAEVSSERYMFGLDLLLFTELGRGKQKDGAPAVSVFGAGVETTWLFAKYPFQPYGAPPQSTFGYSFNVELRGWWFTTLRPPAVLSTPDTGKLLLGGRPPANPVDQSAWLTEPQIRLSYGRRALEVDDSYVVLPRTPGGLQFAEKAKLAPPFHVPSASLLLAAPLSPPESRFAFGPAVRFTAFGRADTWAPWAGSGRGRLELWLYYFAWTEEPAIRIGVAPFLDARVYGASMLRDDVVGGVTLELRASTSRLEY